MAGAAAAYAAAGAGFDASLFITVGDALFAGITTEAARLVDPDAIALLLDLDGTLVKSDSILDALVTAVLKRPDVLPSIGLALIHGRGALKAACSEHNLYHSEAAPLRERCLHHHAGTCAIRQLARVTRRDDATVEHRLQG